VTDNPLLDKWAKATLPYLEQEQRWMNPSNWRLDAFKGIPQRTDEEIRADIDVLMNTTKARWELVVTHAWAVPNEEAIDAIVRHSPQGVVEIGAGTGYWARLIRARGKLVVAYDEAPGDNAQAQGTWSQVEVGGPEKAALWPQLSLFLCWPPYATPMALLCLDAYKGSKLLYVGEGEGMATGDDAFHEKLNDEWEEVEYVALPQWPHIHDGLRVYERTLKGEA
jgi:hypothetical protein